MATTQKYNYDNDVKIALATWRDDFTGACNSCARHTDDPIIGHDGFCSTPAMFFLDQELARLQARIAEREARIVDLEESLRMMGEAYTELEDDIKNTVEYFKQWRDRAYPIEVFPEPNMDEIKELLGSDRLTNLGASQLRHVVKSVCDRLDEHLQKAKQK